MTLKPRTVKWLAANPEVKLVQAVTAPVTAGSMTVPGTGGKKITETPEHVQDTCKRCGGSGRYSFNLMDGDTCYGCSGRGKVLVQADKYVDRVKRRERAAKKRQEKIDANPHGKLATPNPDEYEYIGVVYYGRSDDFWRAFTDEGRDPEYVHAAEMMEAAGYTCTVSDRPKHKCMHCQTTCPSGIVVFKHEPTGDCVLIGQSCAQFFGKGSIPQATLNRIRRAETQEHAAELLNEKLAEFPTIVADLQVKDRRGVIPDMLARLNKYGSLSDKQLAYVVSLAERTRQFEAANAERERALKSVSPVTEGRIEFTGEVLTVREEESRWGPGMLTKLLLQDEDGRQFWGNCPRDLEEQIQKGDRVSGRITVRPSDKDPHFGFFKRPTFKEVQHANGTAGQHGSDHPTADSEDASEVRSS